MRFLGLIHIQNATEGAANTCDQSTETADYGPWLLYDDRAWTWLLYDDRAWTWLLNNDGTWLLNNNRTRAWLNNDLRSAFLLLVGGFITRAIDKP